MGYSTIKSIDCIRSMLYIIHNTNLFNKTGFVILRFFRSGVR